MLFYALFHRLFFKPLHLWAFHLMRLLLVNCKPRFCWPCMRMTIKFAGNNKLDSRPLVSTFTDYSTSKTLTRWPFCSNTMAPCFVW